VYLFETVTYTVQLSGLTEAICIVVFTLVFALAADFGLYLHHVAFHQIPFLWEFHKVHHSAEVLTPLTDFRLHPLELVTNGMAKGILLGLAQGIFGYLMGSELNVIMLAGMNAVFFFYFLSGYMFRHSHLWISYGPVFSKVFISPAQHQIHHSSAQKHWDRSFGGTFAVWDWLFGTLYVPKSKEQLTFGIGTDTHEYRRPLQLYVRPFLLNLKASRERFLATLAIMFILALFAGVAILRS